MVFKYMIYHDNMRLTVPTVYKFFENYINFSPPKEFSSVLNIHKTHLANVEYNEPITWFLEWLTRLKQNSFTYKEK